MLAKHRLRLRWSSSEWADWAVRVFKGNRGSLYINEYEERIGSRHLRKGIRAAMKRGLIVCDGGPPSRKWYSLSKEPPDAPR